MAMHCHCFSTAHTLARPSDTIWLYEYHTAYAIETIMRYEFKRNLTRILRQIQKKELVVNMMWLMFYIIY